MLLLLLLLLLLLQLLLLRVVLLRWAVAVWRLVMAVVAVMAAKVRLELGEGGALFATLADLALWHLRNTCGDTKDGLTVNIKQWITGIITFKIICQLTHQPAVVSAVVEEQLLVRVDLCGCAEEQFTVGRVSHQVLLLTAPKHTHINTACLFTYWRNCIANHER